MLLKSRCHPVPGSALVLCVFLTSSACDRSLDEKRHHPGLDGGILKLLTSKPSPITIVDGSVHIHSYAKAVISNSSDTWTITFGDPTNTGQACTIYAPGSSTSVRGSNWTITSADTSVTISTSDGGATVSASGKSALVEDTIDQDGPGYKYVRPGIRFSPATLAIAGGATSQLGCKANNCQVIIDYEPTGMCH